MDKSFVTMEQQMCLICGCTFDTGAILLDRRMRDKFEQHTTTGTGLCPEHQKLHDDGYIALVGVDPVKSLASNSGVLKAENAYRTGKIAWLRRDKAKDILNMPPEDLAIPFAFIEHAALDLMDPGIPEAVNTEIN